jgi:hypothetical protein
MALVEVVVIGERSMWGECGGKIFDSEIPVSLKALENSVFV